MSYRETLSKHARLAILRFCEGAPKYTTNASMLSTLLPSVGIELTRDQIVTELHWLREQGMLELEETKTGFWIATATVTGVEIAQGVGSHPGIQRPRPGS
ncbi:MAG: hypothetical protein AAGI09_02845 [Pseudomonadota bacterium]